jgi:hypothetical protein
MIDPRRLRVIQAVAAGGSVAAAAQAQSEGRSRGKTVVRL